MDTPSQTAQAKTRELLNKKNRYRSGLGFKDNGQNSDLKRNVIDEVKIKKKIVGDIKKLKQTQQAQKRTREKKKGAKTGTGDSGESDEEIEGLHKFYDDEESISKFSSSKSGKKSSNKKISVFDPRSMYGDSDEFKLVNPKKQVNKKSLEESQVVQEDEE